MRADRGWGWVHGLGGRAVVVGNPATLLGKGLGAFIDDVIRFNPPNRTHELGGHPI